MSVCRSTLSLLRDAVLDHAFAHGAEDPPMAWTDQTVEALQECLEGLESPEIWAEDGGLHERADRDSDRWKELA